MKRMLTAVAGGLLAIAPAFAQDGVPTLTTDRVCPWKQPEVRGPCVEQETAAREVVYQLWSLTAGPAFARAGPTWNSAPLNVHQYCTIVGVNAPKGYERMADCLFRYYRLWRPKLQELPPRGSSPAPDPLTGLPLPWTPHNEDE